eukprot:m.86341 g.86341  ORF g.86341 m.86341 type:complete len:623 (+) comp8428_c0_seq1:14-1882(+)
MLPDFRKMDDDICRVCRGEATPDAPLFHPCICTGSIRYIHQSCLEEWLEHSHKRYCELCGHEFRFEPMYREGMPKRLTAYDLLRGGRRFAARALDTWARVIIVIATWAGVLPIITRWLWQFYFESHGMIWEQDDPMRRLMTDWMEGLFLCAAVFATVVSALALRDFIVVHDLPFADPFGPPAMQHFEEHEHAHAQAEVLAQLQAAQAEAPVEDSPSWFSDDDDDDDWEDDDSDDSRTNQAVPEPANLNYDEVQAALRHLRGRNPDDFPFLDPAPFANVRNEGNNEPDAMQHPREDNADNFLRFLNPDQAVLADAGNQVPEDEQDMPDFEFDDQLHFNEELPLEEILGLVGPLSQLLDHLLWTIIIGFILIGCFAFVPTLLGHTLLQAIGIQDHHIALPALVGYAAFILCGLVYDMFFKRDPALAAADLSTFRRLLSFITTFFKVAFLMVIELGVSGIVIGFWLDICSLELQGTTLAERKRFLLENPMASIFFHWLAGIVYVYYVSAFLAVLREETLRPGVLWVCLAVAALHAVHCEASRWSLTTCPNHASFCAIPTIPHTILYVRCSKARPSSTFGERSSFRCSRALASSLQFLCPSRRPQCSCLGSCRSTLLSTGFWKSFF